MKSFIIAFSTYSKIPMPRIEWDEKSMKYSMCFFPLVGVVLGCIFFLCGWLCDAFAVPSLVKAVILTSIPILLTGGIHMDGFMDTVDAKSSYRSKEERLEILKDPHAGAFAILYCVLYLLAEVALFSVLEKQQYLFAVFVFVYSRILSGLSVVTFPKAKETGMLSDTAKHSAKQVKWILFLEWIFCVIVILFFVWMWLGFSVKNLGYACGVLIGGLLSFAYYGYMSKKWFGGITGDLAGYFLQVAELVMFILIVLASYAIS